MPTRAHIRVYVRTGGQVCLHLVTWCVGVCACRCRCGRVGVCACRWQRVGVGAVRWYPVRGGGLVYGLASLPRLLYTLATHHAQRTYTVRQCNTRVYTSTQEHSCTHMRPHARIYAHFCLHATWCHMVPYMAQCVRLTHVCHHAPTWWHMWDVGTHAPTWWHMVACVRKTPTWWHMVAYGGRGGVV